MVCLNDNATGNMRSYINIKAVEELLKIFENKDMEWLWIDLYVVAEIQNAEASKVESMVPIFIEKYESIFTGSVNAL